MLTPQYLGGKIVWSIRIFRNSSKISMFLAQEIYFQGVCLEDYDNLGDLGVEPEVRGETTVSAKFWDVVGLILDHLDIWWSLENESIY